jgi:hypothetical protein
MKKVAQLFDMKSKTSAQRIEWATRSFTVVWQPRFLAVITTSPADTHTHYHHPKCCTSHPAQSAAVAAAAAAGSINQPTTHTHHTENWSSTNLFGPTLGSCTHALDEERVMGSRWSFGRSCCCWPRWCGIITNTWTTTMQSDRRKLSSTGVVI